MIPWFPNMKDTDTHHLDTVSNLSSPSHLKKNIPSNISEVRTRSTTKKLRHCLENHKGYSLTMVMMRNAHVADNLGTTDQFQEHVYFS
jgi:hypothetical protein